MTDADFESPAVQARVERIVRRRVDEFAQHNIVEQLQDRLDKSNHIRELIVERLDKFDGRLVVIEAKSAFGETLWGRASLAVGMLTGVVIALHDTGVLH